MGIVRWLIVLVCVFAIVVLIADARGPKHHRGDAIGSHGTTVVIVRPVE